MFPISVLVVVPKGDPVPPYTIIKPLRKKTTLAFNCSESYNSITILIQNVLFIEFKIQTYNIGQVYPCTGYKSGIPVCLI